jgi:SAM-dependent methyltransferase
MSALLANEQQILNAKKRAKAMGLCPLPDQRKYWDNMIALETLEESGIERSAPIVDLGCRSGILLTWLYQRGFRCLHGCDLRRPLPPLRAALRRGQWSTVYEGTRMIARHRRHMRTASVEETGYASGSFAAATCMSVIEHGVQTAKFFEECARILRSAGLLVLSTDYWPEPVDLGGRRRFGRPDRIYDQVGALELRREAELHGLRLRGELVLDAATRVIESDGLRFTFLCLVFDRE